MIKGFNDIDPKIHKTCFIADSADVIGDVEIKEGYCLDKKPNYFANSAEKT